MCVTDNASISAPSTLILFDLVAILSSSSLSASANALLITTEMSSTYFLLAASVSFSGALTFLTN